MYYRVWPEFRRVCWNTLAASLRDNAAKDNEAKMKGPYRHWWHATKLRVARWRKAKQVAKKSKKRNRV